MPARESRNYSRIDRPEINGILFYPRLDAVCLTANQNAKTVMIPVGGGGVVSSLWAETKKSSATILFFHGNGELASEYIDIAGLFRQMNISFICVDYRGYGRSSGNPTVSLMMEDAQDIFKYVSSRVNKKEELLIIMGRSLGCASALEIAAASGNQIDGLIIESGFAETLPLLRTLGADPDYWKIREEDGFANNEKIKTFSKPLLIIHAENDFLIPVNQAEKLFAAANSRQKEFLKIPDAGHNDIFFTGTRAYLTAVNELIKAAAKWKTAD
jgi:alpha-beta hydrolase superfamily lysophospholipase